MGISFNQNSLKYIYELTGGHPFVTRQLCSFISQKHPQRPLNIQVTHVKQCEEEYLHLYSKDFVEIMDRLHQYFPIEYDICIKIAQSDGKIDVRNLVDFTKGNEALIRHLTGYQIARLSGHELNLSMNLLTRWLQRQRIT